MLFRSRDSYSEEEFLKLNIQGDIEKNNIFGEIVRILLKYPGDTPVLIYNNSKKIFKANKDMNVAVTGDFLFEIKELLGANNVKYGSQYA